MAENRKILAGISVLLVAGGFFIFNPIQAYAYQQSDQKANSVSERLSNANNEFGMDMMKQISSASNKSNVVISPLSISSSLTMAYTGSRGDTSNQMKKTLNYQDISKPEANSNYRPLIRSLENVDSRIEISIANSAWIKQDYPVKDEYKSNLKENYRAEVNRGLDKQQMNNWVKENTNGNIKRIVKNVRPLDRLFLINAVYFNGKWKKKFDKSATSQEEFSTSSGKVGVSMMSQTEEFGLHKSEDYRVARLPYGRNKVAMYVLLPDRYENLEQITRNLTTGELETVFEDAQSNSPELRVKLPKFETEYSRMLTQDLKSLGMNKTFSGKADFTGVSDDGNLYISSVRHKTFIEVDEKGTEAATSTSTGTTQLSASASIPTQFIVDRPFIFFIRDDRSGTNLFVGKIVNPNK